MLAIKSKTCFFLVENFLSYFVHARPHPFSEGSKVAVISVHNGIQLMGSSAVTSFSAALRDPPTSGWWLELKALKRESSLVDLSESRESSLLDLVML